MSLSESIPPRGRGDGRFVPESIDRFMPKALKAENVEAFFREPSATLRIPGTRKRIHVHTDRVRAKPAVTPTVSASLGMFSIGLGLVEVLAPKAITRFFGMSNRAVPLIQAHGVRELTAGFGLASGPSDPKWLWARVAGDFLDLATLAAANHGRNPHRHRVRNAMTAVVAITVIDALCGSRLMNVKRSCDQEAAR